jgi:hypothetical protein
LAEAYLRVGDRAGEPLRIVDKAPVKSDYLGVIHSVFPNARIIYIQRDPIDACLSCYLANYYPHQQQLMAHWSAIRPPEAILNVPYEELVADQEGWIRKILDFLGLEWDRGVCTSTTQHVPW